MHLSRMPSPEKSQKDGHAWVGMYWRRDVPRQQMTRALIADNELSPKSPSKMNELHFTVSQACVGERAAEGGGDRQLIAVQNILSNDLLLHHRDGLGDLL